MHSEIRKRPEGALLRAYFQAAGISPDAISKPLIGIVTVATQIFSERPQARELGTFAVKGVEAAGGVAVRWDSIRTPEMVTWGHAEGYSFAWRDQLADLIESWTRQEAVDGVIFVGDSSKTLAGMAMAAARLNVPALIVTTGASHWITSKEGAAEPQKTPLTDPYSLLSQTLFGKKKDGENTVDLFSECLMGQDTHATHAFELALEALGVTLPGMATAPVQSARRNELAQASGQRVVALAQNGQGFRRALSINAFTNAIRLSASVGGSTDVAIHLMALAHEAGVTLGLDVFDRIARETPQVCRLGGVGTKAPHRLEDLERAGGVWAIMHTLKDEVSPATTLSGKGASELARTTPVRDAHVIVSKPLAKQSGVGLLYGNLVPKGAVFLLNQILPELSVFRGPAAVFENEIDAAGALCKGEVKKGAVLIVRGQGPRGGPGLRKLRILPALMASRGWNKTIALITDGRLPDTPAGLMISLASPEGAAAGPIAVVKTGDLVEIDVEARKLSVRLTDLDLRIRISRWQAPEQKRRGFLDRYSRQVSEAHEGAVLK